MKKSICILFIFSLLHFFVFLYFHRPIIPFQLINPSFTWRSYEISQKYTQNNKTNFIKHLQTKLKNESYLFLKNDFPYHVNAQHYVLWLKNENVNISKIIQQRFSNKNIKYFQNYHFLKSIPEIKHYQIFVSN